MTIKTLLLPDNLLEHEGVLFRLVNDMDEDTWSDQVQIIGWLYQYYNSELKRYRHEKEKTILRMIFPLQLNYSHLIGLYVI